MHPTPAMPMPIDVGQMFALGFSRHQQGLLEEAASFYAAVLRVMPDHFDALHLSGVIAHAQGDDSRAEQLIRKALKRNPDYSDAWSNLGQAIAGLGRPREAIQAYDRALALNSASLPALFNRGAARAEIQHYAAALSDFDQVLQLAPDYPEAHNFRSLALCGLEQFADAISAANRALELRPKMPEALINRAVALRALNRHKAAISDLCEAISQKPQFDYPRSLLPTTRMMICDWTDLDQALPSLRDELADPGRRRGAFPLDVLALSDDPDDILRSGAAAARRISDGVASKVRIPRMRRHSDGRIRIAYISSDFGEHPVAHLMCQALEMHDRSRFEVHGVSILRREGERAARIRSACEYWHELAGQADEQAADYLRGLGIDIAVGLNGYTAGERNGIFARRVSSVQVNFLGFAATMGAQFMDYIIVDPVLAPRGADRFYTEKLVRLPVCYQPCDTTRELSEEPMRRSDWGLPEKGFVFCSFNSNFKIMPDVFACWMRLLRRIEGSVLWLRGGNADAEYSLREAARQLQVDPDRIVFAKYAGSADHNARHRLADLFVDTFPYNAHTTANDALWAGLPVLTLAGQCYHSRVAASLLHAAGLEELVMHNLADYEALAVALASDPARLGEITARLRRDRDRLPLFDMRRWVANLEEAYLEMARRALKGQPPAPIHLPSVQ